ncbi:NTPase [Candidatus Oleimmundimicrobium sp.]|uniref:NTPase n=1 Tax=Candidatus Oleimmundimicrobium sp. TaxID=3060597 RepID=UPI0027187133|nr:NTPase [Candidatus Oleimmundimicrobium sp.]MDO8886018.1 NTPase [Candidatus Oleimmundimicrobium sp.]
MNILITSSPGVGKTTLIKKVLTLYSGRVVGFYTEEIREVGRRRGFKIKVIGDTDNLKEGILAHENFPGPIKVGRYGVNIDEFERIGVLALEGISDDNSLIIIDEIGKMELHSDNFKRVVENILNSPNLVLATIGKIKNEFIEQIKARKDVMILELSYENREKMPEKIINILKRGI